MQGQDFSEVARCAILRCVHLAMTVETAPHRVVYDAFRNGSFCKIPMARRTRNFGRIMRCMAKFHMSIRREAIHPHPRNLNILVSVSNDFLHAGLFLRQLGVAEHTFSDGWNASGIASVGSDMAVNTLQPELHVSIVRECQRLLRGGCKGAERNKYQLPERVAQSNSLSQQASFRSLPGV